ncbi:MAG: GNAT family N-acetyltransferase [Dehalococcoidia bacterium]|nr:GNAT family N-acetyltransferase [Dehalococcoidia bacterium]
MIEGRLINLRAREMSDIDRNYRRINDREVTRYLNMRYPISLAAEESWMRAGIEAPVDYAHVAFAIETKDGTHIGNINFHLTSPEDRSARLGIAIGDKAQWSKGYGTDAMLTLLRFGFDEMNLHRIDLTVDADNDRARACYRACGLVEEARLRQERYARGEYRDQLVMGILRDEFYALHGASSAPRDDDARR